MNTKRINCQYCNGTMPPPNTPPAPQLPASSARLPYGYAGWPREEYYAVAAQRSALAQSCIGSSTAAFNAAQNLLGNGMAQFDLPPSGSGMLPPTNSELFRQLDSFMLRTDQSSLFDAAELKLPAPPQHRERANHHGLFTKAEASATFPASEVPDSSLQNQMESHLSATSCAGAPATVSHAGTSKSSAEPPAARPSKTRVRWTQELHERFVECINQLGGADQATPKKILKLINSDGLTIYHVKSHLQKYRMTNYAPPPSSPSEGKQRDKWGDTESPEPITGMHITEALRVQLDLQRRLGEQLEMQRSLQVRIEEQGKMLQKMFEHQLKASGNSAPVPPDSDDDNVLFLGATAEQDDDVFVDIVIDDEMQLMSVANDD